jgi:hypothetical protein
LGLPQSSSLTTKAAPKILGKETGAACSEEDRGLPEVREMKPSPTSYEECYAPKGAQKYTPKHKRQKRPYPRRTLPYILVLNNC